MKKITILLVIGLAAITLGMMTPNFGILADATNNNNNNNKNYNNNNHNNNNGHNDDDDCDDDKKKKYGGNHNDDCDDDNNNQGESKPTVKVYKVVINNQGNPSRTIGDFGIKLNDTSVSVNGTSFTLEPNKPVTLTESGMVGYEFVEIRGDGHCPENLSGTITLSKKQNIECYIVNQPTGSGGVGDPPTVKVYKVVLNHQGTYPSIGDFGVTLNNAIVLGNGTTAIQIPTNTPVTLNEAGVAGYEFVEIRGDGHCPENLGGTITLADGQHIECYIVNRPAGQNAPVEPGVIFHYNTLHFSFDGSERGFGDSCSAPKTPPCVELANAGLDSSILVVDEELKTDTTIVLFSVVEEDKLNQNPQQPASSPLCILSGMKPHVLSYSQEPTDPDYDVDNPSGKLGFEIQCALVEADRFKVSYALIETDRNP